MMIIITVKIDLTKSRTILNWVFDEQWAFEMLSGVYGFEARIGMRCNCDVCAVRYIFIDVTNNQQLNVGTTTVNVTDIKKRRKYLNDV